MAKPPYSPTHQPKNLGFPRGGPKPDLKAARPKAPKVTSALSPHLNGDKKR